MVSVSVFGFELTHFIALLLTVCVFGLTVHMDRFFLALVACVFSSCEGNVIVCHSFSCGLRVCRLFLGVRQRVHDLIDPPAEAADSGVEGGRGGVSATETSGDHTTEEPSALVVLTHQASSRVSLTAAAVEEAGVRRTASTQSAVAGEAVAVPFLTLPG